MFNINQLFESALGIKTPWYIKEVIYNQNKKRLDIHIDFKKGSKFYYEDEKTSVKGNFKAYDTREKVMEAFKLF